jgi:hypothetical protein
MTTLLDGALLGLTLGLRHTLEPDHLAAVGTFVSRARRPGQAALVGALWGTGHAAGILFLGGVVLTFRRAMPVWLDAGLEFAVGVMLLALGARTLWIARERHDAQRSERNGKLGPFAVGIGHGLAGTGAAVLLATAAMPDAVSGTGFLAVFGAGSIVGMAVIAGVASLPLYRLSSRGTWHALVLRATGVLSLVVGAWWLLSAGKGIVSRALL